MNHYKVIQRDHKGEVLEEVEVYGGTPTEACIKARAELNYQSPTYEATLIEETP